MKLAVNCTKIDPSKNLGVLRFGQRLVKAMRNGANAEVVGIVPSEWINHPPFMDTFERIIPTSPKRSEREMFDVELLLHHFQIPCTGVPKTMILHDLHLWDVPWKYPDLAARKERLKKTLTDMDAILTEFPRTYYDLPKVVPQVCNRLFLTISPSMVEYAEPDANALAKTRAEYGIREHEKVILYPAQLRPHKNHRNLFRAVKILERSPIKLVCTGSELQEDHATKLCQSISELGLGEKIVMAGMVDDHELENLYHIADLVVSASLAEGGAYIAQEAIVYGKNVVCSDIRPARLHLRQMRASIPLFNPLDPRDIAEAISSALETPQDNARARAVIQSWTWDKLAEQYCRVLDWVKAGKPAGQMPLFLDDSLGYLRRLE